ncbi:CDP-archaeol synthase [Pseudoxanthobacter sp. M-2]|uniref:phosphatidate cytidylyltransferase n=1 Tax=Pseudoxanthobacter sp. M-2 TaxID=3078754 RepID=UPI0038FC1A28
MKRAGQGDLVRRAASALVLAPIVLVAVWLGGLLFAGLVAVVAAIVMLEWWAVTTPHRPRRARGLDPAATITAVAAGAAPLAMAAGQPVVAALILIAGAAVVAFFHRNHLANWVWPALGIGYAGIPAVALVAVRDLPGGLWMILALMVVVWATDSVAYFGGRAIGGAKLWPRVSPGKTWSGAICGLVGGVLAGGIVATIAGGALMPALAVAAILSIVSQIGDLAESAIKRRFGVKDSGKLIPGHGGVMDRVDGLLVAAVAAGLLCLAFGAVPAFAPAI